MSDEKKDDKKDEKKDDKNAKAGAKAGDSAPAKGGIMGMLGPAAAVVVLVGIGAGIGFWAAGFLSPPASKDAAAGKDHGGEHGKAGKGGGAHDPGSHDPAQHSVIHTASALSLGPVSTNIIGNSGKRYIKMEISLWLSKKLDGSLAGGGHGGGPTEIVNILKSSIEEKLNSYTLTDFDSPAAMRMLEKDFADVVERELRSLFHAELKDETKVVHRVVITNRLMQ